MDYKPLHSKEVYQPMSEEILTEQLHCIEKLYEYNQTRPLEQAKRQKLLKEMFHEIGENCYIEPPLHANWAGKFVTLGKAVYANFNLTLVDDTFIQIGDYTMIGPNVTIATAAHPENERLRQQGYQYNLPITIGKNCWICANVMICPGVHIGDGSIIGAGSVVTKDIPPHVVAYGNPCRVIRKIDEGKQ